MLRFPGGKKKAAQYLMSLAPDEYREFREPFLGGNGLLLYVPQNVTVWLNDKFPWVYWFWKWLRDASNAEDRIMARKAECQACIDGEDDSAARHLFIEAKVRMRQRYDPVDYLMLNLWAVASIVTPQRKDLCSFSRLWKRDGWAHVHLDKIRHYVHALQGCTITCQDYSALLDAPGDDVFIFLDPPYLIQDHASSLYAMPWTPDGYEDLGARLRRCKHRWMLTVSNSRYMQNIFAGYRILRRQYTGTMVHRPHARRNDHSKTELIIMNY